jgi:hypothetical protein
LTLSSSLAASRSFFGGRREDPYIIHLYIYIVSSSRRGGGYVECAGQTAQKTLVMVAPSACATSPGPREMLDLWIVGGYLAHNARQKNAPLVPRYQPNLTDWLQAKSHNQIVRSDGIQAVVDGRHADSDDCVYVNKLSGLMTTPFIHIQRWFSTAFPELSTYGIRPAQFSGLCRSFQKLRFR